MSLFTSRFFVIVVLALFGFSQSFQIIIPSSSSSPSQTRTTTTTRIQRFHHHFSQHQIASQRSSSSSDGGPAILDRPETVEESTVVEKEDVTEQEDSKDAGSWEVRLFNDPFNKREFVARCLSTICGKSDTESYQIMMKAHKDGMGVIDVYAFEVAELYHASLQDNGLLVEMVPVGDEE